MTEYTDFQEIAHCGGRITFTISCDTNGRRFYSQSLHHSRPTPAAFAGIFALAPHGLPVGDFRMAMGIEEPSPPNCLAVLLGSDTRTCWGHQCPTCKTYFRNGQHPAIYPLTCPHCGHREAAHKFLTEAQKRYVTAYVNTIVDAMQKQMDPDSTQEIVVDMDALADQSVAELRTDFYYAAESQQTRYNCNHCNEFNDIRGLYGYCAACGWRNNRQMIAGSLDGERVRLNAGSNPAEQVVRNVISQFDACCRDLTRQIASRIPMKSARAADLCRAAFHDIDASVISTLKTMFEIDLLRGLTADLAFLRRAFHRRHVFEHNAGVADERYVRESGDAQAKIGVLLRETKESANRLVGCVNRMIENFDCDFHEVFLPNQKAIELSGVRPSR